jgi:ribosomal protein S18 acetylase RimI-like enzyme
MATEAPRPAREASETDLLEIVHAVRRELVDRGEAVPPNWTEDTARDLRSGRLAGWVLGRPGALSGLVLIATGPGRAYGHVHAEPGSDGVDRAITLVLAAVRGLEHETARLDFGATGLGPSGEETLGRRLAERPDFDVIRRFSLVRPLALDDPPPMPQVPSGLKFVPVRTLPLETLHELDWRSYRGSPDQNLISDTPQGNRRMLEGILQGELGRFVEEASAALVDPGGREAGFVLTVEESPRRGSVVDLAVDPERRRRGLGRALLLRALRALLALGYERVRLWVTETNAPARALYESTGFRPDATAYLYRWQRPASERAPSSAAS